MNRKIADAGNTVVPAILVLEAAGFRLEHQGDLMTAEKAGETFVAEGPVELLGLIALIAARGRDWAASDDEIDRTLQRFGRS